MTENSLSIELKKTFLYPSFERSNTLPLDGVRKLFHMKVFLTYRKLDRDVGEISVCRSFQHILEKKATKHMLKRTCSKRGIPPLEWR
jgi:hypothetical protein